MTKKIFLGLMMVLILISTIACQTNTQQTNYPAQFQKQLTRTSQFESELPENYEIIDFKERALGFDSLVYNFEISGTYLPLIWENSTYDTYSIAAYVGDYRHGSGSGAEAVTNVAAVLSASLLGVDKSDQDGHNYVDALNAFFNPSLGIVVNTPGGSSPSMWYAIYPGIIFTEVSLLYEDELLLRQNALTNIESWYQAYLILNAENNFDVTGFDFATMTPIQNGIWREPDSAVGISMLMYYGYQLTGETKYKDAAITALSYIEDTYFGSPMYEILMYYGPYLAALYNQEFNTSFDINRMFNHVFNGNSIPRGGWGMINGTWGDFSMSGLMGSISDGGGYAFSMNGFAATYIMAKTAKYDTRFAASIGKWLNHIISNSRYYFSDYVPNSNESLYNSTYANEAQEFNEIAGNVVPYEGIRRTFNSRTPWFGGDPTIYNWARTDFSLYSGAHMGMMASIYEETNIEGILKIDLNQGDFFNDTYPTYMLYNPHQTGKVVSYDAGSGPVVIYDSVTQEILGEYQGVFDLEINANDARIIVELPVDATVEADGLNMVYNQTVISRSQASVNVTNLKNNDTTTSSFSLNLQTISSSPNDAVDYYEVSIGGTVERFETDIINITSTPGSKTVVVTVHTKNGLSDQISIRLTLT